MTTSKRVTLADVARQTGLSSATVSFVLNSRPGSRIPESTAQRVRQAATELGYSPDPTARGLRTGRTDAVGFISDEVTLTRYASAMIRGVLDVGEERNRAVIMSECDNQIARMERAVEVMQDRRIDGLLFGMMRARQVDLPAIPAELPTILVNGFAPGHPCVLPDEYAGGLAAVEHIVRHGHRSIGFIGRASVHLDPYVSVTIAQRLEGIDEGMRAAGLTFAHEVRGSDWEPELGFSGTREMLAQAKVTAILVANDRIAFGAYQAAAAAGLSVPGDLSIMSFDDEQLATYLRPAVTTMHLPYQDMGRLAMTLLLQRVDGKQGSDAVEIPSQTLVPMRLVERGSVADLR